jgi:hypothetical protein
VTPLPKLGLALAVIVATFLTGMFAGMYVYRGKVAQRDLQQLQQATRERIRLQEFAAPKAAEHAATIETLNTQLVDAYAEIANLSGRACLDGRTVGLLNATGNLSRRPAAPKPADPGPVPQATGDQPALRWASNIDVGQYIAYCRAEYAKVADQLNKVLDIEDRRFPPNPRNP